MSIRLTVQDLGVGFHGCDFNWSFDVEGFFNEESPSAGGGDDLPLSNCLVSSDRALALLPPC